MNIADELFNARQTGDADSSNVEQKISSIIDFIDTKL